MLKFEIKKQLKSKTYIILFIFAILTAIYNLAINEGKDIGIVNEVSRAYGGVLYDLSHGSEIIKDLSDEDKDSIINEYTDFNSKFQYNWDDDKNNDETYAQNLTKQYRDRYVFEDSLIKKYNLKLDTESKNAFDWGLFEAEYMVQ